jgi:DNA-binding MarR family transcriptional regulator
MTRISIRVKYFLLWTHRIQFSMPSSDGTWTFLTNHSHILICLARNPEMRIRDLADAVGITERAVQRILFDLERAAVISIHKEGRRNHYVVNTDISLRHPVEAHCQVRDILKMAG